MKHLTKNFLTSMALVALMFFVTGNAFGQSISKVKNNNKAIPLVKKAKMLKSTCGKKRVTTKSGHKSVSSFKLKPNTMYGKFKSRAIKNN